MLVEFGISIFIFIKFDENNIVILYEINSKFLVH